MTELKPGVLAFFENKWDEKTGQYIHNNSIDTIRDCFSAGEPMIEYCYKSCHSQYGPDGKTPNYYDHKKCNTECSDLITAVKDTCQIYPSRSRDIMKDCAKKCGDHPIYDYKCLQDNKDQLITCCMDNCRNTTIDDCKKECSQVFDYISNDYNPWQHFLDKYSMDKDVYAEVVEKPTPGVAFSVIGVVVLLFTLILFVKK